MIKVIDGFHWPIDSPVNLSSDTYLKQPPSAFMHGTLYRHKDNGKGLTGTEASMSSSGSTVGIQIVLREKLDLAAGKLVLGISGASSGSEGFIGMSLSQESDKPAPSQVYASAAAGMNIKPQRLPSLIVTATTIALRETGLTSATYQNYWVASRTMTAVSNSKEAWYEVVYDTEANTIEVFVDDVSVLLHPYVFTEEQKTQQYVLSLYTYGRGSYPWGYFRAFYAGDERVGPCRIVARYANADVSVPEQFGTGPHYSKLNGSFDPTSTDMLSTKEDATAEFSTTGPLVENEIKGVAIYGRLSTTDRSAYETEASVKYGLRMNSNLWTSEARPIPIPSVLPLSIDHMALDKNPITNQPFTKEEVNSLGLTLTFDVTNKF